VKSRSILTTVQIITISKMVRGEKNSIDQASEVLLWSNPMHALEEKDRSSAVFYC
jgi:hypothetical protein